MSTIKPNADSAPAKRAPVAGAKLSAPAPDWTF